jgi:hypothetical protein
LYGHALKAWGTPKFKTFIQDATRDIYYGDEDNGGDQNGGDDHTDQGNMDQEEPAVPSGRAERAAKRAKTRNGASNTKKSPDFHDMLLGIWILNARGDQRKARAVKAEKTKEKVQLLVRLAPRYQRVNMASMRRVFSLFLSDTIILCHS